MRERRQNVERRSPIDAIAIPPKDRFRVISEYKSGDLIYDADYLGMKRCDKIVFVQVTLSTGRKPAQKRALFKPMAELLAKSPGLRPENLLVNLVEVSWELVVWERRSTIPEGLARETTRAADEPPSLQIR